MPANAVILFALVVNCTYASASSPLLQPNPTDEQGFADAARARFEQCMEWPVDAFDLSVKRVPGLDRPGNESARSWGSITAAVFTPRAPVGDRYPVRITALYPLGVEWEWPSSGITGWQMKVLQRAKSRAIRERPEWNPKRLFVASVVECRGRIAIEIWPQFLPGPRIDGASISIFMKKGDLTIMGVDAPRTTTDGD